MESKSRVRLDFTSKSGVKMTKSTIVEAVKLLSQNPRVSLKDSTRNLIEWVSLHIVLRREGFRVYISLVWGTPTYTTVETNFEVKYGKIASLPVEEALPLCLANLISATDQVEVLDTDNDDFV